jgi:hypothetical protein
MDPSSRHLRAADLRHRLAELAAELLKTEEALVALESDGQLKLNAATALATTRAPCTPAERVALFRDLFGARRPSELALRSPSIVARSRSINTRLVFGPWGSLPNAT